MLATPCTNCGSTRGTMARVPGCPVFSWCVCLFCFTGIFCFWIPFVSPGCYDLEVICTSCGRPKGYVEADCC